MPTYAYSCKEHLEFEVQQSIKDPPLQVCPKCKAEGKEKINGIPKRLISLTSFILTGGGWAKSGYSK